MRKQMRATTKKRDEAVARRNKVAERIEGMEPHKRVLQNTDLSDNSSWFWAGAEVPGSRTVPLTVRRTAMQLLCTRDRAREEADYMWEDACLADDFVDMCQVCCSTNHPENTARKSTAIAPVAGTLLVFCVHGRLAEIDVYYLEIYALTHPPRLQHDVRHALEERVRAIHRDTGITPLVLQQRRGEIAILAREMQRLDRELGRWRLVRSSMQNMR